MKALKQFITILSLITSMHAFFGDNSLSAQSNTQMVRLAKLIIDSTRLESYKAMLKEEIETSVRLEPGVLTLFAVTEKK